MYGCLVGSHVCSSSSAGVVVLDWEVFMCVVLHHKESTHNVAARRKGAGEPRLLKQQRRGKQSITVLYRFK
jgi:hypothetical protein